MYRLIERFHKDLGALAAMPLEKFFDYVKKIPYQRDTRGREVVARPGLLLKEFPSLDCKKKAILICAWARCNGIPFRLVACSERPDKKIHHVFPQIKNSGRLCNADATYSKYVLGQSKNRVTRAEVLKP